MPLLSSTRRHTHLAALTVLVCAGTVLGACNDSASQRPWAHQTTLAHSSELDASFFDRLPALVIAVNQAGEPDWLSEITEASRTLAAGCPRARPKVCEALGDLAAALVIAQIVPEAATEKAWRQLARAKRALNRSLAEAGVAYYVDTAAMLLDDKRVALALSFSLKAVRRFRAGNRQIPALVVERGDRLNWSYEVLGFAGDTMDEAIVQADVVDREIAGSLCPPLNNKVADSATGALHSALREELEDVRGLDELAQLCRARLDHWHELRNRVRTQSRYELGEPQNLTMSLEERGLAAQVLDAEEMAELDAIESSLVRHPALARLREHLLFRTAVHEVQHVVDLANALAMPKVLAGQAVDDDVAAEVSAYLAEIAHAPASARSSLARLELHATTIELLGSAEERAATLILKGLGHELRVSANGKRLADAARALWRQWFRQGLPTLVEL